MPFIAERPEPQAPRNAAVMLFIQLSVLPQTNFNALATSSRADCAEP